MEWSYEIEDVIKETRLKWIINFCQGGLDRTIDELYDFLLLNYVQVQSHDIWNQTRSGLPDFEFT
jgi:hypothetical protein